MQDIIQRDTPFLVTFEGLRINVDGILAALLDGTSDKYPCDPTYSSLLDTKFQMSHFIFVLENLIDYGTETDGWYRDTWERDGTKYAMQMMVFDEFCFLAAEGLIEFDSFETMTHEQIHSSFMAATSKNPDVQALYGARTRAEMRREYARMVKECHPDLGGDGERIKEITVAYSKALANLSR